MSDSFVTPWSVAHQALLSVGFYRQEYWSRLLFPSPGDLPNPGICRWILYHWVTRQVSLTLKYYKWFVERDWFKKKKFQEIRSRVTHTKLGIPSKMQRHHPPGMEYNPQLSRVGLEVASLVYTILHGYIILGEGNGNPLQCSCLENPGGGGAWWAAVSGVAQSRTRLKRLSSSSSSYIILLNFHSSH